MRVSSVLIGLLAWTRFGASAIEEDAASFTEPALDSILLERAAASCGVSGYRRSTRPYLSRIFSYELSTAKLCGDRCWKESQCKSYSFGYGTCSLFKVEVSRNFKSNSRSPFKFYDKSCAKPAQPKCGLKGYDNKDKDTRFFTKTNCNLAACSALCKSKDRCKSMRHSGTTCNFARYVNYIKDKHYWDEHHPAKHNNVSINYYTKLDDIAINYYANHNHDENNDDHDHHIVAVNRHRL
ncbi:hypothetical protein CB0940_05861 [Cercospora beticola]|uniref:Apple domain-containing protein n=1 Tax=Cercospora beticola TaxID=122368 RepID=A0A2G5HYX7_CERBT|nr:hypothetical protein CB0940_05861 [Cercospora beticola]PIA97493.1 hypothetical protein CB0940_05861 [Cercospora beticola]WPA98454.1 hypothetical protein RHO25_003066 [Cercospora beticola]